MFVAWLGVEQLALIHKFLTHLLVGVDHIKRSTSDSVNTALVPSRPHLLVGEDERSANGRLLVLADERSDKSC